MQKCNRWTVKKFGLGSGSRSGRWIPHAQDAATGLGRSAGGRGIAREGTRWGQHGCGTRPEMKKGNRCSRGWPGYTGERGGGPEADISRRPPRGADPPYLVIPLFSPGVSE